MINHQLAKIFREIAILLEIEGVEFKPRAFERAAEEIERFGEDVLDIYKEGGVRALDKIPAVGKGIAEKIEEYIKTDKIKEYVNLKKKIPVKLEDLMRVEGVGPKTIKKLYKNLKIKTLGDLERVARAKKIRGLEGFGKATEERILDSIDFLKESGGRHVLGFVLSDIEEIESALKGHKSVERIVVAGSVRRRQESVGDVDILITSKKPKDVMNFFVGMSLVDNVLAKGVTKTMVRLKSGLEVDLRVVDSKSFGAAMQYFTGSKEHNIKLRKIAIKKGYKLNEYGLYKGKKFVAGKTEEEIYKKLGLDIMPPEIRTGAGELEAARNKKIPKLIPYGSLRGDLQIQTNWTDGADSIEEMAHAAKERGLSYILITDHTKSLAMTGGADEKKLLLQMRAIDKINKKLKSFKILKGAEVNIMRDGTLDIKDEVLAKLDVVGVAVHSHFNLSRDEQTKRIVRAIENPHADILLHPTGRIINKRKAYDLDMKKIIKVAKRTGTVLEVDAYPNRLDLKDEHVRLAVEAGVKLSISSDAHAVGHLDYLEFGVAQARRGWAKKSDVINAWPVKKMLGFLKDNRRR